MDFCPKHGEVKGIKRFTFWNIVFLIVCIATVGGIPLFALWWLLAKKKTCPECQREVR